ncbi:hypothetical protein FIV42_16470 [Persicimonas caeni]|uniref:Uncharacterized protein n=1 Tax=Persicimonas caeni TaxID=2292766 RepID=A0A4Y6PV87_PERCE|nr:contractile injection system tape measure protein [Persicimonas caeni]QDG52274.1 hypothetical protein FIV42_16470 [Persicimonas caeni]QED33496.1 hypothetical protein FRD00_16465 [Persicimonas caeni]
MSIDVDIRALDCRFHLPEGMDDAAGTRQRLTKLAGGRLVEACAEALDALPDDGALWRVRHVHLDICVDAKGMSDAEIADLWGQALARALGEAMASGGASEDVRRFESARAFVVAFLRDLIDGRAHGRWYYEEFRHLQSLPAADVTVELLGVRPAWIVESLVELAGSGHLERLVARWTDRQSRRLIDALGLTFYPPPPSRLPSAVGDWLGSVSLEKDASRDAEARNRWRLFVAALSVESSDGSPGQRPQIAWRLAHAVATLQRLARRSPKALRMLIDGRVEAAAAAIATESWAAPVVGWLTEALGHPRRVEALAALARASSERSAPPAPESSVEASGEPNETSARSFQSAHAAIFLVAAPLANLEVWPVWVEAVGEAMARRWLYAVGTKLLGGKTAALRLDDAALAAFAGLPEPPKADARAEVAADNPPLGWAEKLEAPDEETADFLWLGRRLGYPWLTEPLDEALSKVTLAAARRFARTLPRFEASSVSYLSRTFLAQPGAVVGDEDALEVRLDGGPLGVVLRMAVLPDERRLPWLDRSLTITVG